MPSTIIVLKHKWTDKYYNKIKMNESPLPLLRRLGMNWRLFGIGNHWQTEQKISHSIWLTSFVPSSLRCWIYVFNCIIKSLLGWQVATRIRLISQIILFLFLGKFLMCILLVGCYTDERKIQIKTKKRN